MHLEQPDAAVLKHGLRPNLTAISRQRAGTSSMYGTKSSL